MGPSPPARGTRGTPAARGARRGRLAARRPWRRHAGCSRDRRGVGARPRRAPTGSGRRVPPGRVGRSGRSPRGPTQGSAPPRAPRPGRRCAGLDPVGDREQEHQGDRRAGCGGPLSRGAAEGRTSGSHGCAEQLARLRHHPPRQPTGRFATGCDLNRGGHPGGELELPVQQACSRGQRRAGPPSPDASQQKQHRRAHRVELGRGRSEPEGDHLKCEREEQGDDQVPTDEHDQANAVEPAAPLPQLVRHPGRGGGSIMGARAGWHHLNHVTRVGPQPPRHDRDAQSDRPLVLSSGGRHGSISILAGHSRRWAPTWEVRGGGAGGLPGAERGLMVRTGGVLVGCDRAPGGQGTHGACALGEASG